MADKEQDIVEWLDSFSMAQHTIAEMMTPTSGYAFRMAFDKYLRLNEAANEIRKLRELVETKDKTG